MIYFLSLIGKSTDDSCLEAKSLYYLSTILFDKNTKNPELITKAVSVKSFIDQIKISGSRQNDVFKKLINEKINIRAPLAIGITNNFEEKFKTPYPIMSSIFKNFTIEESIYFLLALKNDKKKFCIDLIREVIAKSAQKNLKAIKEISFKYPPTEITFPSGNTISRKNSNNNEGGYFSKLLSCLNFSKKNSQKTQKNIMQGEPPSVGITTHGNQNEIFYTLSAALLVAPSRYRALDSIRQ